MIVKTLKSGESYCSPACNLAQQLLCSKTTTVILKPSPDDLQFYDFIVRPPLHLCLSYISEINFLKHGLFWFQISAKFLLPLQGMIEDNTVNWFTQNLTIGPCPLHKLLVLPSLKDEPLASQVLAAQFWCSVVRLVLLKTYNQLQRQVPNIAASVMIRPTHENFWRIRELQLSKPKYADMSLSPGSVGVYPYNNCSCLKLPFESRDVERFGLRLNPIGLSCSIKRLYETVRMIPGYRLKLLSTDTIVTYVYV